MGDGIVGARQVVEEGQAAEKVAAPETCDMSRAACAQGRHDAYRATPDPEQFVARSAAHIERLAGLVGAQLHARFQVLERLVLALGEQIHLLQLHRHLLFLRRFALAQDAVLDPGDRAVQLGEDPHRVACIHQAGLLEKLAQIAAAGQVLAHIAEQQTGTAFLNRVPHLIEQMRGGDVHRLHALQVDDDVAARVDLMFEVGIELLCIAEEQAALQFEDHRLVALLVEYPHFGFGPVPGR